MKKNISKDSKIDHIIGTKKPKVNLIDEVPIIPNEIKFFHGHLQQTFFIPDCQVKVDIRQSSCKATLDVQNSHEIQYQQMCHANSKLFQEINAIDKIYEISMSQSKNLELFQIQIQNDIQFLYYEKMQSFVDQNEFINFIMQSKQSIKWNNKPMFPNQYVYDIKTAEEKKIKEIEELHKDELYLVSLEGQIDEISEEVEDTQLIRLQLQQKEAQNTESNNNKDLQYNNKIQEVSIIFEQTHQMKRFTRSYCVIISKKEKQPQLQHDGYEGYIKRTKNINALQIDTNDRIKIDDQIHNPWWSASKPKTQGKANYQFNKIQQQQKFNYDRIFAQQSSVFQLFYQEIEIFIQCNLYRSMDNMLKQYSFNSKEYYSVFNNNTSTAIDLMQFVSPLKQNQYEQKQTLVTNKLHALISQIKENQPQPTVTIYFIIIGQQIIFMLADKNRKLLSYTLKQIHLKMIGFNNLFINVLQIEYTVESFQVKDIPKFESPQLNHQTTDIQDLLDFLSKNTNHFFQTTQVDIKLCFKIYDKISDTNYTRNLNFILLTPFLIENNEIFSRQMRSALKKEKDIRESLGPKLDQLTRLSDKSMFVVEIPEALKLNGKETVKVSKIKQINAFLNQIIVRKKAN